MHHFKRDERPASVSFELMKIDGKTKLYGIIGWPLKHTFSPRMQNAAFRTLSINALYVAMEVEPGKLKEAFADIRAFGFCGVNVTIPHKESCIKYLDKIDPFAKKIGAVNTIVVKRGRLIGYNTDALGFLQSLKEDLKFNPKGKSILLLGAGGAARAVAFALLSEGGRSLDIYDTIYSRAKRLAKELKQKAVNMKDISSAKTYDLIVNATPCGMKKSDPLPIEPRLLHKGVAVYDLIYNPPETKLIKLARSKGLRASGGLGMLLHQGAIAFNLWTGKRSPLGVMRKSLKEQICRTR